MRAAVIFYSRTGATRTVATALASKLDADIGEIRCPRYRTGLIRYLLAGYNSVKGNLPAIEGPAIDPAGYDLVVIGTPVWTSHPSLPVRAYLAAKPALPEKIALIVTHGGHSPAETAISELSALLPAPPVGTLTLQNDRIVKEDLSDRISAFAETLLGESVAGS